MLSYTARSRKLATLAARCIVLNGVVFLGSLALVERLLAPTVAAAVDRQRAATLARQEPMVESMYDGGEGFQGGMEEDSKAKAAATAAAAAVTGVIASGYFVKACHALFLWPVYVVSLIVNSLWYGDIAKTTFPLAAGDRKKHEEGDMYKWLGSFRTRPEDNKNVSGGGDRTNASAASSAVGGGGEGGGGGVFKDLAAEVYRVLLVSVFFARISAVTIFFPGTAGRVTRTVLETWLYAFYCFDYRWSAENQGLKWRLNHFEGNWAYFSGFGSPCVFLSLASAKSFEDASPFWTAGIMAMAFPLFMMMAMGAVDVGDDASSKRGGTRQVRSGMGVKEEGMGPE